MLCAELLCIHNKCVQFLHDGRLIFSFMLTSKDKSGTTKNCFLELHLFCSNDSSNFFGPTNISFQMLEE